MSNEIYNPIIAIFNITDNEYQEYYPRIYREGQGWTTIIKPWVYDNGQWYLIGGAGELQMAIYTSDGKYLYTSDGKAILVRKTN